MDKKIPAEELESRKTWTKPAIKRHNVSSSTKGTGIPTHAPIGEDVIFYNDS